MYIRRSLLAEGLKEAQVFLAQGSVGEQVGAVGEGFAQLLLAAPAADLGVIAVEQDLGDGEPGEFGGSGVVGVVEQAAGTVLGAGDALNIRVDLGVGNAETFKFTGRFVAEDAGEQAHDGVNDDGGRQFAPGEDVVADGEFFVAVKLIDALVDALVAATDEDDAVEVRELAGDGLGEGAALGAEEDDAGAGGAFGLGWDAEGGEGLGQRLGLEDHALAAAEGAVIHGAVAVMGEGAQVVRREFDVPLGQSAAEDSVFEEAGEEGGEDGDNVEPHTFR